MMMLEGAVTATKIWCRQGAGSVYLRRPAPHQGLETWRAWQDYDACVCARGFSRVTTIWPRYEGWRPVLVAEQWESPGPDWIGLVAARDEAAAKHSRVYFCRLNRWHGEDHYCCSAWFGTEMAFNGMEPIEYREFKALFGQMQRYEYCQLWVKEIP